MYQSLIYYFFHSCAIFNFKFKCLSIGNIWSNLRFLYYKLFTLSKFVVVFLSLTICSLSYLRHCLLKDDMISYLLKKYITSRKKVPTHDVDASSIHPPVYMYDAITTKRPRSNPLTNHCWRGKQRVSVPRRIIKGPDRAQFQDRPHMLLTILNTATLTHP